MTLFVAANVLDHQLELDEVVNLIELGDDGCSMYQILEACRELGLPATSVRLNSAKSIVELPETAVIIANIHKNHFVLLIPTQDDFILMAEYPHPLRTIGLSELSNMGLSRGAIIMARNQSTISGITFRRNSYIAVGFGVFLAGSALWARMLRRRHTNTPRLHFRWRK